MKYVIEIDEEKCIACATCYSTDPAHFEGDAKGKANVVKGTNNSVSRGIFDDEKIAEVRAAADTCPVSALRALSISSRAIARSRKFGMNCEIEYWL